MKKWKKIKKTYLAVLVTGILVIGAGIAALVNASGLQSMFEPKDFAHFENEHADGEEYDSVSGNGEDSDLTDEKEERRENTGEDVQKALLTSEDQEGLSLADHRNPVEDPEQNTDPDMFEFTEEPGAGSVDTKPDGEGNPGGDKGERPGNDGDEEKPGVPEGPETPGRPGEPEKPVPPDVPDKPVSWEDEQLNPRDPIQTERGILIRLRAEIHKEYYPGEIFREEDATVTATFRKTDGSLEEVILPYGGVDGYTVQMSTKFRGKYTATFTYLGVSARAPYEVISSAVDARYYGESSGRVYGFEIPGPLGADPETMKELEELKYYPDSSGTADLTDIHGRLIAYLGDDRVKNRFLGDTQYKNVCFFEEKDGYLTTMLTGFQYYENGSLQPGGPYLYYPVFNWGMEQKNVADVMRAVPEGFRIRRVVRDADDWGRYRGSQVLEQYTGGGTVLSVPSGVTDIRLKGKQGDGKEAITSLVLPESAARIDFASIAEQLPELLSYRVSGGGIYQSIDGVLYSRDGRTLISVPAGKKDLRIPDRVTTIAKGAFLGSTMRELDIPETVIRLETGCLEGFQGDVIRIRGEEPPYISSDTGYTGKVLFSDSAYDVVLKRGMFAFQSTDILFGAMDTRGVEIPGKTGLYQYDGKRQVLVLSKETDTLAGIPAAARGYYIVPDGITAVAESTFVGVDGLREVRLPGTIKKLQKGSLVLSEQVKAIYLTAGKAEVSPMVFGDPASGAKVPAVAVYVEKADYETYLAEWSRILDPVYGSGTAKGLLGIRDDTIFYEGEAKYQKVTGGGTESYRLLEVYAQYATAFQVKEGTIEIASGAFAQCGLLEILYLPDTLKQVEDGAFECCENLGTVTVKDAGILSGKELGSSAKQVRIYEKGSRFSSFLYDGGIVYGVAADGSGTLLDVPTDYAGALTLRERTVCLNEEALKDCASLTEIMIPDQKSLAEIGNRCFENCAALETLYFDKAVFLERMGDEVFRSCTNLRACFLPDCLREMGKGLFYDCISLQSIKAAGVAKIGDETFFDCQSLLSQSLVLNWNQMTAVGDRAFAYCSLLASLPDMPGLQSLGNQTFFSCQRLQRMVLPESLTGMGEECFGECGSLTQVAMNGRLTGISRYCFYGCKELVKLEFGSRQKEALQVIGVQAFGQCTSLESLDLSEFPSLTQMGERTFTGCEFLTTVKLPEKMKKVPDYCFESCENLSILTLTSKEVPELGEAVFGEALSPFVHIWVEEGMLSAYDSAYREILDQLYGAGTVAKILGKIDPEMEIIRGITFVLTEEGRVLKEASDSFKGTYTVPIDTVRIEAGAFAGCTGLTEITLPEESSLFLGDGCFRGCTGLETVNLHGSIPNWGDEAFMDCTALKRLSLGSGSQSKIPRVGTRAFKGCTGLVGRDSVSFRAWMPVLGEECFAGCENLGAILMTEQARDNLEVIEDRAFEGCRSMTQFLVSRFTGLKTIGSYAFADCDSLLNPSVPANVTSVGEGCFANCDLLQTVSFYCVLEEYPKGCFRNCPNLSRTGGVAAALTGLKRIGEGAYEGCISLTTNENWNLGKYQGLEEIGANAFRGCANITEVTLSSTLKQVGYGAFDDCIHMSRLVFGSAEVPDIGTIALSTLPSDFCIRVPDSQADGDRVYRAYLAIFTEMLGEEQAYRILDSASDGASARNPLPAAAKDEGTGGDAPNTETVEIPAGQPEASGQNADTDGEEKGFVYEQNAGGENEMTSPEEQNCVNGSKEMPSKGQDGAVE